MLCIRPNKNEKMVRDQKFLKTLLGKLDRGEIRRDFWLQRKSTQWNNQIRDQAIVTTVQGEDIDPVKICEEIREGKSSQKWIVDGGNRFETWNNFYNNVFALGKNLENYIVPYESTKKDENGNVCGVQVAKMELGEMDESGRASCHEVKDSLFTTECDLVAMAIGQKVDFTPLNDDLKTTDTHASTLKNVYIIGDAFTGPKTIGSAVMEGKKIAKEIEAKYNEGTK